MKQSQIILRFLFPPYQNAAEPVHPAMRPLHNPATSLEASFMFDRLGFFTSGSNMSCIAKLFNQISNLTRIVSLIQRHTLRLLLCRFRTLYRNTLDCCLSHLAVMPIRSINSQANRYSTCLSQQTAFNTFFGPVRRVWAGFFPRQAGLLSWHHPSTATTSQSLLTHHNLPMPLPRASGKFQLLPIPEIVNALCCWNKCLFHSKRSTDSRFAIRKIFRPLLYDPALVACRHQSDEYWGALAVMARFFPIIHLKSCTCFLFFFFSSLNPFKDTIAFEYIGNSGVIRIGSKIVVYSNGGRVRSVFFLIINRKQ